MKKHFLIFSLLLSFLLTSCSVDNASQDITDTINDAIPNLYVTLAQIGAFIVMVLIVIFFGYKPIKKKLDARREYVKKNLDDSDKHLKEAKKKEKEAEDIVTASRIQANSIVEKARKQAIEEKNQMLDEAEKAIALKKLQDEKELKDKEQKMIKDNRDKIISTALDASKEILKREIKEEDNKKIVDDFIDKLNDEK